MAGIPSFTIPFDQLLEPLKESWGMFLLVMMFFIILLIAFLLLEYRANKKARLYNDIVRVLGNSYYALYMIDLNQNQYLYVERVGLCQRASAPEGQL